MTLESKYPFVPFGAFCELLGLPNFKTLGNSGTVNVFFSNVSFNEVAITRKITFDLLGILAKCEGGTSEPLLNAPKVPLVLEIEICGGIEGRFMGCWVCGDVSVFLEF
ncbi:hypothetical protein WICPIJ_009698 [Wickerhamomyces pijperi]|uniref:Uncharacterized protein n=1 Tax=Wickerhamomyces pijperi TaxID=599730 RepID=A0A9P8TCY2_WICPI|nr:hypothetical protein WICPIJ_009698 [Wickerhamomyces pijperi]